MKQNELVLTYAVLVRIHTKTLNFEVKFINLSFQFQRGIDMEYWLVSIGNSSEITHIVGHSRFCDK